MTKPVISQPDRRHQADVAGGPAGGLWQRGLPCCMSARETRADHPFPLGWFGDGTSTALSRTIFIITVQQYFSAYGFEFSLHPAFRDAMDRPDRWIHRKAATRWSAGWKPCYAGFGGL